MICTLIIVSTRGVLYTITKETVYSLSTVYEWSSKIMNGVRNEPFICPRGLCGTRLITKHRGPYSQHSIDCDLISVLACVTTLSIRPM